MVWFVLNGWYWLKRKFIGLEEYLLKLINRNRIGKISEFRRKIYILLKFC